MANKTSTYRFLEIAIDKLHKQLSDKLNNPVVKKTNIKIIKQMDNEFQPISNAMSELDEDFDNQLKIL